MKLLRYTLLRLGGMAIVLTLIAVLTFAIFYLLPTDPAQMACGRPCQPANLERIAAFMGTDQPWITQLWNFVSGILTGRQFGAGGIVCEAPCFGYSFQRNASVTELIGERFPATASLAVGAALLWLVAGVASGTLAAITHGTFVDRGVMALAIAGVSTPVYLAGTMAILVFGFVLGWFPTSGYVAFEDDPGEWLRHLVLPCATLALVSAAVYARLTRGELLDVLSLDYIRTARAKGLRESRVIVRHGLRTALLPVVTVFGLDLGVLLGGTVIIENLFSIPGLGSMLIQGVALGDLQLVVGLTLFAAFLVVVLNFLVDIFYGAVDPRVRVG
jgi:peptide/nickel transport system permease protein